MTSPVLRIAIPVPTSGDSAYNQRSFPQYARAVEAAGGIAVPISLEEPRGSQANVLASCSGVLLPGSPADVDPTRYGQLPVEACAPRDMAREAADDLLLQDAFAHGKPILGICYGLQSLNVWRRGSLIQHLPHSTGTTVAGVVNHQPGREVQDAHPVRITPGARLSHLAPGDGQETLSLSVNSSHHQAIDRPGEQLMIAAVSPVDGVIEALEGAEPHQFVVGVQWHPERSYESSEASRALFAAFLEAAGTWVSSQAKVSAAVEP